jgi:hypothetical protein
VVAPNLHAYMHWSRETSVQVQTHASDTRPGDSNKSRARHQLLQRTRRSTVTSEGVLQFRSSLTTKRGSRNALSLDLHPSQLCAPLFQRQNQMLPLILVLFSSWQGSIDRASIIYLNKTLIRLSLTLVFIVVFKTS